MEGLQEAALLQVTDQNDFLRAGHGFIADVVVLQSLGGTDQGLAEVGPTPTGPQFFQVFGDRG